MKKIITIVLLSSALFGCSRHYPRFVKNPCTGLYAIETGYGRPNAEYFEGGPWYMSGLGQEPEGKLYLCVAFGGRYTDKMIIDTFKGNIGQMTFMSFTYPHRERIYDTIPDAALGHELTFQDEQSARSCWDRYERKEAETAKREAERAKAAAVDLANRKKISDSTRRQELSVFNCLHNYQ